VPGPCDIAPTAILVGGALERRWLAQAPGEDLRAWRMRAIVVLQL
jgi:hypothetical protein